MDRVRPGCSRKCCFLIIFFLRPGLGVCVVGCWAGKGWGLGSSPEPAQGSESFSLCLWDTVLPYSSYLTPPRQQGRRQEEAGGSRRRPFSSSAPENTPPRPSVRFAEHNLRCPLLRGEKRVRWRVLSACLSVSSPGTSVLTATCHRRALPGEAMPTGLLKAEQDERKRTPPSTIDQVLTCLAEDRPGNECAGVFTDTQKANTQAKGVSHTGRQQRQWKEKGKDVCGVCLGARQGSGRASREGAREQDCLCIWEEVYV